MLLLLILFRQIIIYLHSFILRIYDQAFRRSNIFLLPSSANQCRYRSTTGWGGSAEYNRLCQAERDKLWEEIRKRKQARRARVK
ncbi:hypothetical protein DMENIID0001_072220 [Sergentomyia squamirostris]